MKKFKENTMKQLIAIWRGLSVLALAIALLAIPVVAQEGGQGGGMGDTAAQSGKQPKQDRWEGVITRSNRDKKVLTVRQRSSGLEKYVAYDDSTQFTAQAHHGKPSPIDAGQVQDNDRVICLGKYDKKGVLHATLISKRQ
jgi:hypothetical protein